MKFIIITILFLIPTGLEWTGDFDTAMREAKSTHKKVLINFSGSDWCGPCIRFRREMLESEAFENYAKSHLLLVRADFPRQKKNQLSPVQTKRNEALAARYNPLGKFPYTVLVDESGKVLQVWDGLPKGSVNQFVENLASAAARK